MKRTFLMQAKLYLCTPIRDDLLEFVEACVQGGVDIVQLREKHLPDKEIAAAAKSLKALSDRLGFLFIVNDRPDIALISEADGIHLGDQDLDPAAVRLLVGDEMVLGLSTHSIAEVKSAQSLPIDYFSFGPVEKTPTKPNRDPVNKTLIPEVSRLARHPYFVTGNITPASIPHLKSLGATRFCVVRYLTQAEDPLRRAAKLSTVINN